MHNLKFTTLLLCGLMLAAKLPAQAGPDTESSVAWTMADASLFPADQSLQRPEDGVALADGTLLVGDQRHGLLAIFPDGTQRPFGNFAAAGFIHQPPDQPAGPNGVSLDPDGAHLTVSDVFTGAIYRTELATEITQLVYRHPFGVNSARTDSTGALWFTQSTENRPGADAEARMFAAADLRMGDGALYRLAPGASVAELKVGGLDFANGLVVDEKRNALFLNVIMRNEVLGFDLELASGQLSNRRVVAEILTPDNLELHEDGWLWVASPLDNGLFRINPESGEIQTLFHPRTEASDQVAAEWWRRVAAGEPALELISPEAWEPLPGLVTGLILPVGEGPVYLTGLGPALVRLERLETSP